jgi:putative SOS response-associated peptidase YedK
MCGRYVVAGRLDDLEFSERFQLRQLRIEFAATYNAAPSQELPVILEEDPGERAARLMQWGLIPRWRKPGEKDTFAPINARSETVLEKPMFRPLMGSRRCVVPASGFYEWQQRPGGKQPHYITVREQPLIGFAGLYDEREEDGEVLASYTILTTTPNELMATLHNRMPVILHPQDEEEWLSREIDNPHAVEHLLRPYPAEAMEARPVSRAVNNVRNHGPELIEPVEE